MKTITEFSGFVLKEAVAKKTALIAEGKAEEEAQASINELLKLDETKTAFYKNALDMTLSRLDRVKRVVVALKANDAEKVPEAFIEREGHFYLVEYFPQADGRGRTSSREDDFGGRGDSRGGRGGDRGRGGRGGNDRGNRDGGRGGRESSFPVGERAPREPRIDLVPASNQPAPGGGLFAKNTGAPSVHKPVRAPRPQTTRAPREKNHAPRGPQGAGELRLVFKGQSNTTTLQGSGVTEVPVLPVVTEVTTPTAVAE